METMTASSTSTEAPADTVFRLATAYMASAALHVALRLRIADRLASGPMAVDALAAAAGVQPDRLYRVLRALASVGIFEERERRTFASNPAAGLLRSQKGSLYDIALFLTDRLHFQVYAELLHSVSTGQPASEHVTGLPVFELFARDAEESRRFNDAMTSLSAAVAPGVLQAYDFSDIGLVADIAGGHGHVLASILRQYPWMHGILFDLEHVLEGAPAHLREMGVADRCKLVPGDFFAGVPSGADAYLLKHIVHDWDDERALVILAHVARALAKRRDGRVLLIDAVLPAGPGPDLGKIADLEMMVMPGGRERTAEEFGALFARAGLTLTRIVPTGSPVSVIEGRPASA